MQVTQEVAQKFTSTTLPRRSLVAIFSPHLAEMITPALSSIDFPFDEMGRLGTEMLIQQLSGQEIEPAQILLKPPLTIRASSGPYHGR